MLVYFGEDEAFIYAGTPGRSALRDARHLFMQIDLFGGPRVEVGIYLCRKLCFGRWPSVVVVGIYLCRTWASLSVPSLRCKAAFVCCKKPEW